MTWRTLIIDDEPPARKHLRRLLAEHPQIEVVGEASGVAEAVEMCENISLGSCSSMCKCLGRRVSIFCLS